MAAKSEIEWTDASWTPIRARRIDPTDGTVTLGWHCEHVSEGCRNCYAEGINRRLGTKLDFKPGHLARTIDGKVDAKSFKVGQVEMFLDEAMLTAPLRWKKPRRIFVCSMTDLFAAFVPDEWIDRIFAVMALCPQHTFQVLTKRPERMRAYLSDPMIDARIIVRAIAMLPANWRESADVRWGHVRLDPVCDTWHLPMPLPNVWLGTSAEDQKTADARIPHLLGTPAAIRFLSAEPLLGGMDLTQYLDPCLGYCTLGCTVSGDQECGQYLPHLDWVIVGGESGRNARPMHPDWARQIRDQCAAAGVPFFFMQWGEWLPWEPEHGSCWISQNRRSEDAHVLFPCDFDNSPDWDDGLWAIDGQTAQAAFQRVGKKAAGRLLDGVEHDGMPTQ